MTPLLTPEECAKEILLMALDQTRVDWNEHGKKKLKFIADQIREAVEEAHHDCTNTHKNHKCSVCYGVGFADGIERAAKLCEENDEITPLSGKKRYVMKKSSSDNLIGTAYAEAIRSLKAREEK